MPSVRIYNVNSHGIKGNALNEKVCPNFWPVLYIYIFICYESGSVLVTDLFNNKQALTPPPWSLCLEEPRKVKGGVWQGLAGPGQTAAELCVDVYAS